MCPNAGLENTPKMVYINTVPSKNVLGSAIGDGISGVFGGRNQNFGMRGLAPGIVSDVFALNPMPVLTAMVGENKPCMRVRAPVMVRSAELAAGKNGKIIDDINRGGAKNLGKAKTG